MRTSVIGFSSQLHFPRSLATSAAAFGGALVVLGLLFRSEIAAGLGVWASSTAYNHCFLVLPIAFYLAWDRRHALRDVVLLPCPWAALLCLPLAFVWLAAERLGIMEGRQLVVVTMVQTLVVTVWGWRCWWAMSGPLLYLYFLVPFGEFLTPQLQNVTTAFVRHGLDLIGIPAYVDGYVIDIPEGTFFIAEACAGLRFLIASMAFGCLYALLMYRRPGRRAAFIAASIVVPVIANGFRALGIVVLGHVLGSAEAAAADHVVYGWVFFSVVILLLCLIGLPFREDIAVPLGSGSGMQRTPPFSGLAMAAVLLLLSFASAGAVVATGLDRAAAAAQVFTPAVDLRPECQPLQTAEPAASSSVEQGIGNATGYQAGGRSGTVQRIACAGQSYELRVVRFSPRVTPAPVLAMARYMPPAGGEAEITTITVQGHGDRPAHWRFSQIPDPFYAIAAAVWIEGRPAGLNLAARAHMAWRSIAGGGTAPLVVSITPLLDEQSTTPSDHREIVAALTRLLESDTLAQQMRTLAEARSH